MTTAKTGAKQQWYMAKLYDRCAAYDTENCKCNCRHGESETDYLKRAEGIYVLQCADKESHTAPEGACRKYG